MDYKELKTEELQKIDQEYYQKYGRYLEDKALSVSDKKIDVLIKKNKIKDSTKEKSELFSFIKEYVVRQLKEIAIVEYLIMEKSNNWGVMGEQRVSISFCRILLNIPNDREVTQFDADRFRRIIDEQDDVLGKESADSYLEWLKKNKLSFLGISFRARAINEAKQYFELMEVPFYLYATYGSGGRFNFIFGEFLHKKYENINTYLIGTEFIRSPNMVLSVAATGEGPLTLLIRRASCEVIFFNKWQKFFDQSKLERKKALNHPNSAIREGVKAKALALYKTKTTEDVKNIKNTFINEMIDGILWHEIGHKIYGDIPWNSSFSNTDTIIGCLTESLGDWAPKKGKIKGAIERFIEISEKDIEKASRCVYVYLSDNWFVDEEEEFMSIQTDILTSLILHFINKDGSIDFVRMKTEHSQIYKFLAKKHELILDEVLALIKKGKYEVGIHLMDYNTMGKEVLKMYKDGGQATTMEELEKNGNYWMNIFGYVKKFSPKTQKAIDAYVVSAGIDLRKDLLNIITKKNGEQYNNLLREYIYAKYKEIGVLKERKKVDYVQAVETACAKIKMPVKVSEKVKEQFKNIIENGKNYDISISYEGKPDPFIAIVQELMLKTGFGDIDAGMALGELYDPEEPADKRKEYLKNELEGIRDQIESEMYLEVDVLKINKNYKILPVVEDLVSKIDFLDGKKLNEKIKKIEYAEIMAEGVIFDVFVPLKRGYMDWNTSQAVWRINQDLRPDEFIMQWTIDREFLEMLVEAN